MIFNAYQDSNAGIAEISIVSAGHIFAHQGRRIYRPDGRSDFLLFYVAKGSEHFFIENEAIACEGAFVFFKPYEKQIHIQKEKGTSEFYYIHFNAPKDFDLFGFDSSVIYSAKPSTKIVDLFEEIICELQSKQPAYEKICISKFFNILALLERTRTKSVSPLGQYTDKISFVIQKMNMEYEKNLTLDDYATMCNMSKFHFLRIFKNITGNSPIEYRNNIRLEHAKELLSDTDYSVSQIGRKIGYESNVYFCDVFKSQVGLSPTQYRKSTRELNK